MLRILYFNTLCLLSLVLISAAPVKYDQRQEGELNVHASVENVLIVYIPSSSSELINLINLASSSRYKSKTLPNSVYVREEDGKLQPITIDIDIEGPIKRVEAVVPQSSSADVVLAQSQPISVNKPEDEKKSGPTLDGIGPAELPKDEQEPNALPEPSPSEEPAAASPSPAEPPKQPENAAAAPQEKPAEEPKAEEPKAPLKAKSPKFIDISDGKPIELNDKDWNKLRMLSSGLEECTPGQFRNAKGLCEMIVIRQSEEQNLLPLLRLGLSPAN